MLKQFSRVLPAVRVARGLAALQIRFKYSDKVIDHYNNPRNVGSLDKNKPNVGQSVVGSPACGDVMKFMVITGSTEQFTLLD